ncbi:MAG: dipicolinate synthase subunit B [Christensenellaceae bacterium]|jgi:dipicolinate synthase subunit B|nr:dipicolinate synthase subunit B [Christensenellaceae bacterium]
MNNLKIGVAITGSFCTFEKTLYSLKELKNVYSNLFPIFSYAASSINTRYYKADEYINSVSKLCGNKPIITLTDAEPMGPVGGLDLLIVIPCTGNTLAKLHLGITDTPVSMVAKAQLRNNKPVLIVLSTNDALSANLKSISELLNRKNVYLVPFGQDDYLNKPYSLKSDFSSILDSIGYALEGKQLQPILKAIV